MAISTTQYVVYEYMMRNLLGSNYTMDEIREKIGAQPSSEEFPMVQHLLE
jgi:hypothetical protein